MKYEDIIRVIKKCYSKNDVLTTLGYNKSSNQYKLLNKIIKENNIDISHFRNRSEEALRLYREGVLSKIKTEDLFTENSKSSRHIVKKRIINENIIEYKCSICGNTGEWLGNKISLILDHINGINNDNRLENLRLLCPNCHSQTSTYTGRNQSKKAVVKKTIPEKNKTKYFCSCGEEKNQRAKSCMKCYNEAKSSNIPTEEVLLESLNKHNWVYSKTCNDFNVSGNTIGKWVKRYNLTK